MRAFYGSKISEHLTETPEGYLVCLGVPIGRTGEQDYLPRELGLDGEKLIKVYRKEQDVFKPSAIASFEGKPLTDNHPPEDVTSANYPMYAKGTVFNVRRGTLDSGEDALLCDIVVYDANLAAQIRNYEKREISCGYDCTYVSNGDDTYHQEDIIGNHVAVVDKGRAGASVSIKDSIPEQKGETRMGKTQQSIWQRMFNAFVKDAEPSEVLEAMDAMKGCDKAEDEAPGEKVEKSDDKYAELAAKVDALAAKVDKILAAEKREPEHKDDEIGALDEIVEELKEKKTEDEPDEESVTVEPEEINEEEEVEEKAEEDELPEEVEEKEVVKAKDSMLRMIQQMKPIIATLPKAQRKKASDAMAKAYREAVGMKSNNATAYGDLLKRKAADAKATNFAEFGENCRKRNPHYKG